MGCCSPKERRGGQQPFHNQFIIARCVHGLVTNLHKCTHSSVYIYLLYAPMFCRMHCDPDPFESHRRTMVVGLLHEIAGGINSEILLGLILADNIHFKCCIHSFQVRKEDALTNRQRNV